MHTCLRHHTFKAHIKDTRLNAMGEKRIGVVIRKGERERKENKRSWHHSMMMMHYELRKMMNLTLCT